MAELKTKKTTASVTAFIKTVSDKEKQKDSLVLMKLFSDITGEKPTMWGSAIIGYGMYHYQSERSSQHGDWPLAAFSPRKQNLTLYVMPGTYVPLAVFKQLGPHTKSKGCLYIKRLSDVDMAVLKKIIKVSYENAKKKLAPAPDRGPG